MRILNYCSFQQMAVIRRKGENGRGRKRRVKRGERKEQNRGKGSEDNKGKLWKGEKKRGGEATAVWEEDMDMY